MPRKYTYPELTVVKINGRVDFDNPPAGITFNPVMIRKEDVESWDLDPAYVTVRLIGRKIHRSDITTFIIFTGDAHFCSVVKYLNQKLGKKVIVFGITGTFSNRLREVATAAVELPDDQTTLEQYKKMIVSNMAYVSDHAKIIPTFTGTVKAVMNNNPGVSEEMLRRALKQMLDEGLLKQEPERVSFNKKVSAIRPDWQKLHEAGLWDYK